jgi:tetratricopeptide (TPR) repeat protein
MNEARLTLLKSYLKEDPNDPFNYYAIATEYVQEAPETAKEYFDQLLSDFPDYLPTYFHAAQLYADYEIYERAEEIYELGIALARKQENVKTLRELQTAYQNMQFEMD